MQNIAIKVENLSKAYQLGEIGTGTISKDLARWYARIQGKEDPFLRIGETHERANKRNLDVVWSLKDISFEIEKGDTVGIIGRNGAGKSTLLKVLSRVTSPTTGRITGKGRIASLLEVGTGFHPELTGRENIYLNGSILGMRKKEIARKFDEIVDFAGVERYIDTPVKRYSSGMYVRLAFAVAAHLESEILFVDEVLAVGDAEFQRKCLGKMNEVSKSEGKTILFVSHSMDSIHSLCRKSILLKHGQMHCFDASEKVIPLYLSDNEVMPKKSGTGEINVSSLTLRDKNGNNLDFLNAYQEVYLSLNVHCKVPVKDVSFALCFNNIHKLRVCSLWTNFTDKTYNLEPGDYTLIYKIPTLNLIPGSYELVTYIESKSRVIERIDDFKEITVGLNQDSPKRITEPISTTGVYWQNFTAELHRNNA
ncbi:ABC transporter ATP-binding protein [Pedobacter montanisoli]|uniref:ABC transporter ATP-binding protein n=1 Tax=Pedobacter montanisoli TaxID=2923277 RepID=A0ABS9ZVW8_9SPHI|nr:ABC transporter ATP-binding protein [Pedobacter montanisoli]MCJ0742450.1 ABC transporter ATP-binding protein [Pedobacter montanisoli]